MKKYILHILFLLSYLNSFSQGKIAFDAGMGTTTAYSTFTTLTYGIEYLNSISKHINVGITLYHEKYSFIYNIYSGPSTGYGPNNAFEYIEHISSFFYLAPKFDFSVGKNKQPIHFFLAPGVGNLFWGRQTVYSGYYVSVYSMGSPGGRATVWQTSRYDLSDEISRFTFRLGSGFTECITLNDKWNMLLTQEFGLVTSNLSHSQYAYPDVKENYISMKAGFMYKWHKTHKKVSSQKIFEKDYMEY